MDSFRPKRERAHEKGSTPGGCSPGYEAREWAYARAYPTSVARASALPDFLRYDNEERPTERNFVRARTRSAAVDAQPLRQHARASKMVVLRATKKLLSKLVTVRGPVAASDTALGDWYVNRLVVDRQPLLLLVSATSLLSILTPARDVRTLPKRLPALVIDRLRGLEIGRALIDAEVAAMDPVVVAGTQDRSVLGSMVDFAKAIPVYLPIGGWDLTTLQVVEARLAETPCRVSGSAQATIFPVRAAPALLAARWHAA